MPAKIKQQTKKKKVWYNILSSKDFNQSVIGETMTSDESKLVGRSIWVNLADLTRDVKTQNVKIRFRITEVKDNKANTEIIGYNLLPTYIKRVVKVSKIRVDDSFVCTTKDNIKIRIKPILITKSTTNQAVLTMLRKKIREYFNHVCSKETYSKFIADLIAHKLQRDLKNLLKKIYPLNVAEVRAVEKI